MNTANRKILARLKKAEEDSRKSLYIPFKTDNINNLDIIARTMTQHSGVTTTRNMLIEDAVESFIEDAVGIFAEEGITLDIDDDNDFDTVVFSAQMTADYRKAFFDDHEWRYVRIAERKIPKIKYIALYVGAPQSAIKHYAKVAANGFVYDEDMERYKIRIEEPIELPEPIPLGSASPLAVRSHKYTTLQKLFTAGEFRELYERD